MIRTLTALAISATAALITTSASAQTTVTATATAKTSTGDDAFAVASDVVANGGPSAALMLAYGSDHLKFGIGARGGYTLPQALGPGHIYIGGLLSDHFSTNSNVLYVGPEGGYELATGPVILRPYLGLGFANEHIDGVSVDGFSVPGQNLGRFAFWFGATGLYPVTANIGVGADARILLVDNFTAFIFTITAQYHF